MWLPGFPAMSRESLDCLQNELFKKQATHAAATVPFYRDLFSRRGLSPDSIRGIKDLSIFPVVSKSDIVEDYFRFLSDRYTPARLTKNHTSGSTGSPFTSYFDPVCWIRKKYYSKLRSQMICGFVLGEKNRGTGMRAPRGSGTEKRQIIHSSGLEAPLFFHIRKPRLGFVGHGALHPENDLRISVLFVRTGRRD